MCYGNRRPGRAAAARSYVTRKVFPKFGIPNSGSKPDGAGRRRSRRVLEGQTANPAGLSPFAGIYVWAGLWRRTALPQPGARALPGSRARAERVQRRNVLGWTVLVSCRSTILTSWTTRCWTLTSPGLAPFSVCLRSVAPDLKRPPDPQPARHRRGSALRPQNARLDMSSLASPPHEERPVQFGFTRVTRLPPELRSPPGHGSGPRPARRS